MKDIQQTRRRRFLKKGDLGRQLRLTIRAVLEENVAFNGEPKKLRFVVYFEEIEKALILKWNIAKAIETVTGSGDMDSWAGQQIVVYHDPDVLYQGKSVGGLRIKSATSYRSCWASAKTSSPSQQDI